MTKTPTYSRICKARGRIAVRSSSHADVAVAQGSVPFYLDKATGTHVKQPQLTQCLASLQASDVLVVWKFDRSGQSLRDLIVKLCRTKRIVLGSRTRVHEGLSMLVRCTLYTALLCGAGLSQLSAIPTHAAELGAQASTASTSRWWKLTCGEA